MDFKNVDITQEDGHYYGTTATAKYRLTNPSDTVYFKAHSFNRKTQLCFGSEKVVIQYFHDHKGSSVVGDACYALNVDTELVEKFTDKIAKRNDIFRKFVFQKPCALGKVFLTRGFNAIDKLQQDEAYAKVKEFSEFTEDNDPHKEHDFGSVVIISGKKLFWKIDYYADDNCEFGTVHSAEAYLILTLMLAEEY